MQHSFNGLYGNTAHISKFPQSYHENLRAVPRGTVRKTSKIERNFFEGFRRNVQEIS